LEIYSIRRRCDFSVAPAIINDVLKKDFADYTASKQIEKLTMADKSTHFLVDVTKGKTSKEVIFDDQGKRFVSK
jgi:hypothetical protein